MPTQLKTERRGRCLILSFASDDGRHTLTPQVLAAGIETLSAAESQAGLDAVVLHGEGRHFCGGEAEGVDATLPSFMDSVRAFPRPVIAAVEGDAVDAGSVLALSCDLLVAAEGARLAINATQRADMLVQRVPVAWLRRALWLGEPLDVAALQAAGLVAETAPSGSALDAALKLAERMAPCSDARLAAIRRLGG